MLRALAFGQSANRVRDDGKSALNGCEKRKGFDDDVAGILDLSGGYSPKHSLHGIFGLLRRSHSVHTADQA